MYVHTCWHILLKTIFNWRITALQYYVGFHHISALISYRCTHVPSLLNLPPTSNPTPLGCQRNLGFELLCHAANFHWLSDFTPGNVFQCSSVRFSHLLPTLCPQVSSLSASPLLPFRLVHHCHPSGFHMHMFITVFVFLLLTYFTLYNRLWVLPPH